MTVLNTKVEKVIEHPAASACFMNCRMKSWPGCCNGCARSATLKKRQRICISGDWCTARCTFRSDRKPGPWAALQRCDPSDLIIHHHRGHGHTIAKGADLTIMMAEFLGPETGYCRGRGGSMHIADIAGGNLGATGVVGGGLPTAVGIALALQMHRSDQILLSYFGDGASNEGEFHESIEYGIHLETAGGVHLR